MRETELSSDAIAPQLLPLRGCFHPIKLRARGLELRIGFQGRPKFLGSFLPFSCFSKTSAGL
jgi:hypothetical protein